MSVEHMAAVLHHSRAKGTTKLVLLGIANHQGDGGSWPTIGRLATYANCDERSVQRAIKWLRSRGELAVDFQGGGDVRTPVDKRPNRYDVTVICPPWCDRTPNHRDTRKLAGRQLVIDGVTPVSPGLSTGVTLVSPGGVTPVSPKPSPKPDHLPAVVSEPQDTRACQSCGVDQHRCQSVQRAWPAADRHPYVPVSR